MRWPDKPDSPDFQIAQIVTVLNGQQYTNARGKLVKASEKGKKGKTLRNGVKPIRSQFRQRMNDKGWQAETKLSLAGYFQKLKTGNQLDLFQKYPKTKGTAKIEVVDVLNESVGDFDFWFKTESGFRTVVEWETGNISSSHRSLNKMCLALMGGLADAAVLVVPSAQFYFHLTDRIGNIRELQPYFYFWKMVGTLVSCGLLAVVEVEQDSSFKSTDVRDFIPTGGDGNSKNKAKSKKPPKPKPTKSGKKGKSPTLLS